MLINIKKNKTIQNKNNIPPPKKQQQQKLVMSHFISIYTTYFFNVKRYRGKEPRMFIASRCFRISTGSKQYPPLQMLSHLEPIVASRAHRKSQRIAPRMGENVSVGSGK